MPFIQTKTNVVIPREKELVLKARFGKAIECIPGKTENWLMLDFADQCHLYFRGDGEQAAAMLEVKIFGSASDDAYDHLTAALTEIMTEELQIPADHVYVKYEEVEHWGWNGENF